MIFVDGLNCISNPRERKGKLVVIASPDYDAPVKWYAVTVTVVTLDTPHLNHGLAAGSTTATMCGFTIPSGSYSRPHAGTSPACTAKSRAKSLN